VGCLSTLDKNLDDVQVPAAYHLVQEKVVMISLHLPSHILKAAKPCIRLLSSRGVEPPISIRCAELLPKIRVTVATTINVRFLVLAFEVENVNGQGATVKVSVKKRVGIVSKHCYHSAVVVVPEYLGERALGGE
jgi:hypothetical protein